MANRLEMARNKKLEIVKVNIIEMIDLGVNRFSVGVQSLDPEILK